MRHLLVIAMLALSLHTSVQSRPTSPGIGVSVRAPQSDASGAASSPNTDHRGTRELPLFVEQVAAQPTEAERKEAVERRNEEASNARWIVAATVVTSIFTVLLTISTGLLWWDTRKMHVTAERASRALVLPVILHADRLYPKRNGAPEASYVPEVVFAWENFGQTAAIVQSCRYALNISMHPPPAEFRAPRGKTRLDLIRGGAKGADIKYIAPEPSPEQMMGLRSKGGSEAALRYFFVGEVVYEDVFGRRYAREFCVKIFPGLQASFKRNAERVVARNYGERSEEDESE
jgi:hypothetical protein